MSSLDQIVNIQISNQTQAIPQASFSIPAIFGPSNRFAVVTPAPTGNTTSGSNKITNLSSTTGISPGSYISGSGIPSGSYVLSISGNTLLISQNATATATGISFTIKDAIRSYTATAGMLTDGFQITDPEYIRAVELLEQALVPSIFYVGSYSNAVAQVDTITVAVAASGHLYTGKIAGQTWSYTATGTDTTTTIATAIASAINGLTSPTWNAVAAGAVVTITSTTPGLAFTDVQVSPDPDYVIANTTPNHSIVTDIQQAQVQNDTWYGLSISSNADSDISQVAAFIEGLTKIFIGVSNTAAIASSATNDLGSQLKASAYKRTSLMFSIAGLQQGIEAAWLTQLVAIPGSNNWAFKTLVGITPDVLSSNQQSSCIGVPASQIQGKNVNIYQTVGGVNITQMGTMAGGQFMDITVFLDWLKSTLQTNIYAQLVLVSKIPYTDKGTTVLMQAVKAAIDQGVSNGGIDGNSPISITAPAVLSVPQNQRAGRVAPTISFSARLAGAFNAVVVQGTVTV